jgi:hypothetical protein
MCVVGGAASIAAFVIGFVPPSRFENGSTIGYVLLIAAGTGLIGLLPAWLFLRLPKPGWKSAEAAGAGRPRTPPELPRQPLRPTEPPPPFEPEPVVEDHRHRRLYLVIGGVVVALIIVGLLAFNSQTNNAEAQQNAQQLAQKFDAAGLAVPISQDDIVRSLGTRRCRLLRDRRGLATGPGRGLLRGRSCA